MGDSIQIQPAHKDDPEPKESQIDPTSSNCLLNQANKTLLCDESKKSSTSRIPEEVIEKDKQDKPPKLQTEPNKNLLTKENSSSSKRRFLLAKTSQSDSEKEKKHTMIENQHGTIKEKSVNKQDLE